MEKFYKKTGQKLPDVQTAFGNHYDKFEEFQQKAGKMMYETDEILLEKIENKKAVKLNKENRSIEGSS